MSPLHSQTLQQIDQLGIDISSIDRYQNMDDRNTGDVTKDRSETIEESEKQGVIDLYEGYEDDDFGYIGRDDFLVESNPKSINEPLKRFGYDFFASVPSTFIQEEYFTVPSDYIIGPGDEIKILLFGSRQGSYSLEVSREGAIFFPEIGPVSVAGLEFSSLKKQISQIVSSQFIGTEASISLGELKSVNIFVLGEASSPGMYQVSSLTTMTNAIFASGGIKPTGSLRNLQLKRGGEVISNFDLYTLLLNGDVSDDKRLMSGDVIFIPPVGKTVGIAGEVKRPGIYELKENETASDLLKFSGNKTAKSDLSRAEIKRISEDYNGFNLILTDLSSDSGLGTQLDNGDTVSVYSVDNKIDQAILIKGHFPKPGFFPWKNEMRLSDILTSSNELLPLTDLNYLLVQRKNVTDQSYKFLHINLKEFFLNPQGDENITLNNRDEITFFPMLSFCEITGNESSMIEEEEVPVEEDIENVEIINEDESDYSNILLSDSDETIRTQENQLDEIDEKDEEEISYRDSCRQDLIEPALNLIKNSSSSNKPNNIVRIVGNVIFPGQYPLTENATVGDLINAAGNFDELSYLEEIEITRETVDNKEVISSQIVDEFASMKNLRLQPKDTITVKQINSIYETVTLSGEVYFPGEYIIKKGETLLSLINRAGGLTDQANPDNLVFTREAIAEQQRKTLEKSRVDLQKQLLLIQAETADKDQSGYLDKLQNLATSTSDDLAIGRLVFSYESIVNNKIEDIELRDGDTIHFPQDIQTVNVIGEVYAPNAHIFNPSSSVKDYISSSGGVNEFGDLSEAYIIKGDGSVYRADSLSQAGGFFRSNLSDLEGGDTIVVPLEIRTYPGLQLTKETTQIIYQLAFAAAAINRI